MKDRKEKQYIDLSYTNNVLTIKKDVDFSNAKSLSRKRRQK